MKDIVIKKTSDESQRIVLQTDSETLDYQSRFTVMTVTGNIDGLVNPFRVGSVTSLYEISQFLADNSSASIDVNILSQDVEVDEMEAAVPRIWKLNFTLLLMKAHTRITLAMDMLRNIRMKSQNSICLGYVSVSRSLLKQLLLILR